MVKKKSIYAHNFNISESFILRKTTITVTDNYQNKITNLTSIPNDSAYNLLDYYVNLDYYQTHISWIYLAKHLSTPKYSLYNDLCYITKPRSSILIILLLFISGNTGAAINPRPRIDCSYCDKIIRYNSNYFMCQSYNLKVHLSTPIINYKYYFD